MLWLWCPLQTAVACDEPWIKANLVTESEQATPALLEVAIAQEPKATFAKGSVIVRAFTGTDENAEVLVPVVFRRRDQTDQTEHSAANDGTHAR
jgi:hypothetical protein